MKPFFTHSVLVQMDSQDAILIQNAIENYMALAELTQEQVEQYQEILKCCDKIRELLPW